jgi:hypothetical protein
MLDKRKAVRFEIEQLISEHEERQLEQLKAAVEEAVESEAQLWSAFSKSLRDSLAGRP